MAKRIIKKNLKQETQLLSELLKEYINKLIVDNKSKWTIQTYKQAVNKFIVVMGDIQIGDINKTVIDKFKIKLKGNITSRSINTHISHLRALLNYSYEQGYISKVEITLVKVQKIDKWTPTQDDLEKLLIEPPSETYSNYICRLTIMLMATTGIRCSEIVSLNISNYHKQYISSNHTKNNDHRYMPIPPIVEKELIGYIRQYRSGVEDRAPLFTTVYGERYTDRGFRRTIGAYGEKRIGRWLGTHCLRRYFITYSLNNNVNPILLSKISGHKNVNMLTTYYNTRVDNLIDLNNNTLENIKLDRKKMIKR